jgi:hypothetical protein
MMVFSRICCAQKLAKGMIGKGTTFSRATTDPSRIWASAPEASRRQLAWAVVVLLTVCVGVSTVAQAQNTESTVSRNHRAPRGCVYTKATILITSANVSAPREFARSSAVVGSSVDLLFEAVAGGYFPANFLAGEAASIKPNWLTSAPLRVTQTRPRQAEVLLCGLHGVNDSE